MPPSTHGHGPWWVILQGHNAWKVQSEAQPVFDNKKGERRRKVYVGPTTDEGADQALARLSEHLGATVLERGR